MAQAQTDSEMGKVREIRQIKNGREKNRSRPSLRRGPGIITVELYQIYRTNREASIKNLTKDSVI